MPIDPSFLLNPPQIQVPNPLAVVGEGAKVGNSLMDLITKQATIAAYSRPDVLNAIFGQAGQPGGGMDFSKLSPEDLQQLGPAMPGLVGAGVQYGKNMAEMQSFLAGAAEKKNVVIDTAVKNLSNNAAAVLRNPTQLGLTTLLQNYGEVQRQMAVSGFSPQLKLPQLSGLDPQSIHAWLQPLALLNASPNEQQSLANVPYEQWVKKAELSLRAQEMGRPELKQNELSGQLERVAPMPGGGVLPPGPPPTGSPLTAPAPGAPVGAPQQGGGAQLQPGTVTLQNAPIGDVQAFARSLGGGAPPPNAPVGQPTPAPAQGPVGQFAPTAREKLNAPAMDTALKSVNDGALEATKMIPVLNAVEGMARHMDAGGVWGKDDSLRLLNMASAVPGLVDFIDVPALSNSLTFNAATAQLWAAMEKQLSSRGSVVALQASKSVKLATGDNPAATEQKIDYFRNAYYNELELARAVNQRPNTFDLQGLDYRPRVWTPYKVVAPDGDWNYARSPQEALLMAQKIRERQMMLQQPATQGAP